MYLYDWMPIVAFASPSLRLDGLNTLIVDATHPRFTANASFLPDKTALWKHPLEEDGWTLAHNALRGEIETLKNVLSHLGDRRLAEWEVESLQAWMNGHMIHVRDHHYNEDKAFTPYMETRIVLPEKLTTDHVPLVRIIEDTERKVAALKEGSAARDIRAMWGRYERMMLPHLHEEELVGLPLLRAYFEPAEVGALVEKILSTGPPVSLGSFFYFMGGTREACSFFMANEGIPWFVWYLAFSGHVAVYEEKMVKHVNALLHGVPPLPDATRGPSAFLLAIALVVSVALLRRASRRAGRVTSETGNGFNVVAVPPSPDLKTLSPSRKFARVPARRIC